ncbi:NADP-dependent oxidoreductase domain-containing protein [Aspergillus cavernicola]|uniref:NADP-dependent oxidoreductase domain-containing protein n=1 Tax=Aspergillus cavernicola TaxID=176166 RepID=A0ABR4IJ06_9EURO
MKVIFGAMNIGDPGDDRTRVHTLEEAKQMIDTFQRYGHKDIDTARIYGNGSSETYLGRMNLSGVNLHTKLFPTAANPNLGSAVEMYHHSPKDLRRGLLASIEALDVPKLHVWYLHSPDRTVPLEETMREVNALYEEGYFEKLGISNYQSWEVARMCEICEKNGWIKPSVCQGIYNAFHRAVEPELLRCLRHYGISYYCFNPLAAGMLTSRYSREVEDAVNGGRFDPSTGPGQHIRKRYYNSVYFDALDRLRPVASRFRLTEIECALRWLIHHSQLRDDLGDGIVIGSSSVKQLEENLKAFQGGPLPQEIVDALDEGWEVIRATELLYWH